MADEEQIIVKKKSNTLVWVVLLALCCALPAIAAIFLVGMVPTFVMYMVERRIPRYVTYCVGSFNFAGTLPFALTLVQSRMNLGHVSELLSTPTPWLIMYGSASLGLAIYSIIPNMIKVFRLMHIKGQLTYVEKQKETIIQQWGDKIKEKH